MKNKFLILLMALFLLIFNFNAFANEGDIKTITKYSNKDGNPIYIAPSESSEIIGTAFENTSFEVVYGGESDGWSQIVAENGNVFMKTEDLSDQKIEHGHWVPLGKYKTTGYCNCRKCCGKWSGGPTASGRYPISNHTVACGSLPLGTKIMMNGQQYIVEDRGVTGRHIDVYYDSHKVAYAHGVKYIEIFRWVE